MLLKSLLFLWFLPIFLWLKFVSLKVILNLNSESKIGAKLFIWVKIRIIEFKCRILKTPDFLMEGGYNGSVLWRIIISFVKWMKIISRTLLTFMGWSKSSILTSFWYVNHLVMQLRWFCLLIAQRMKNWKMKNSLKFIRKPLICMV